ncbi:MAG: DGQHR domain-containing protein [Dysgonomonas sp.]|uniref:DGQHR domain-containing protein n=1 Tax=Dysgonomonas sp. TaxID=1891233 RepID=UPI0039E48C64
MARQTKKTKKKVRLTPEQKAQNLLKRTQENEIRAIFKNLGFYRLPNIDGKEIVYKDRTSEMDDIFVCENIILITEYTIAKNPGEHIKNKTIFYNKVIENKKEFVNFLNTEPKLNSFKKFYEDTIKPKYSLNQLKIEILYCSRFSISEEHKKNANGVVFFDYHLVQYFKSLARVIKRTGKYEFCDFIGIPYEEFGDNILKSDETTSNKYLGHILPEEKSYFKGGYKIVSFYIDANSLMRRSFVLRQEGWRKKDNIGYYQRMFDSKKISNMRKYLSEKERVFINNIITTISEDKIKLFDNKDNELTIDENGQFSNSSKTKVIPTKIEITDECNIIGLIDGQHRTFAYHEGDDIYENKIKSIRDIQNLLVTGIIFPKKEKKETRLKFEANLFLEINNTQTKIKSQLTQEIELMINPFSSISIGKKILIKLNENGPLENLIEQYSFERGKLKTASIVSFGLKPLIKLDEKSTDSLFYIWSNSKKMILKDKETEEYELLEEYTKFCIEKIRDIFIAIKNNLSREQWYLYSHDTQEGVLNVTFFNGILNLLRFLIENNQVNGYMEYSKKLSGKDFNKFPFKSYKSSQYRKMGQDIYVKYFK